MLVDFDQMFKNMDGKVMKQNPGSGDDADLNGVCVEALLNFDPRSDTDGKKKADRYDLALRIKKGGRVRVEAEEVALMKELVGKVFGPLVVGQAYKFLENDDEDKTDKPSKGSKK